MKTLPFFNQISILEHQCIRHRIIMAFYSAMDFINPINILLQFSLFIITFLAIFHYYYQLYFIIVTSYISLLLIKYTMLRITILMTAIVLIVCINNNYSAKGTNRDMIIMNSGQARKNSIQICDYGIFVTQKKAILYIDCPNSSMVNLTFLVSVITDRSFAEYVFELIPEQGILAFYDQEKMYITADLKLGISWSYHFGVSYKNNSYELMDQLVQHKYKVVFIYVLYSLAAILIFPIKHIYYKHMEGVSMYSMLVSIQLSFCLAMNVSATFYIYFKQMLKDSKIQTIASSVLLFVVIACLFYHECHKIKKMLFIVNEYQIANTSKYLLKVFGFFYSILGMLYLFYVDKTIFTFVYFTSGAILYMATFVTLQSMKKYMFSFRLILFDCLTMATLVACSTYYPINHFRIFSVYKMIAVSLIIGIILLNAGIVYILVNVVRKEIKEKKSAEIQISDSNIQSMDDKIVKQDSGIGKVQQNYTSISSNLDSEGQFQVHL